MMSSPRSQIRCREIAQSDIDGIVNLLTSGFRVHSRNREFWACAIKRLSEHPTPPGFAKYGYLLESDCAPVGVILLIYSSVPVNGETRIRCNVSSWYVEPAFRSHAAMLVSRALKRKQITYFNITPAPHTLPILDAEGYTRYCSGRFVAVPALSAWCPGCRVKVVTRDTYPGEDLQSFEIELMLAHENFGCISLICSSGDRRHAFVFAPRRKYGLFPFAYLVYCRDLEDFVRFAGPLGRFLAGRGFPLVVLDSNGPIPGLIGMYSDAYPKYFKGPDQPRLGDLAYSERAMFGV